MKINICARPVSLAAFVVTNVCDNVRLQHLQTVCIIVYRRRVIAAAGIDFCSIDFIYFCLGGRGYGREKVGTSMVGIFSWWRE